MGANTCGKISGIESYGFSYGQNFLPEYLTTIKIHGNLSP